MRPAQNPRLCVDGRMLGPGGTGVSTYARAVADAQRVLSPDAFVLHDASTSGRSHPQGRLLRWLRALAPVPARVRHASEAILHGHDLYRLAQVHFDIYDRLLEVRAPIAGGIMHWTYPLPLRLLGWRNVYTLHDAIPLTHPALSPIDPARHSRLLRRIVGKADALVTVSVAARAEIAAALEIDASRIIDCSQPVSSRWVHAPPPAELPAGAYLLALGSVERRKNIGRLLAAYAASGVTMPLVIAGPSARHAEDLEAAVAATQGIARMPYVSPSDLPSLIAGARALVMPSLAEGFGLPVAEAMALGTPVVTSSRGALAETAGSAALLVDPEDVAGIAAALRAIVADDDLHRRLSSAGRDNARRFSPDLFAARLRRLYLSLLAAPAHAR